MYFILCSSNNSSVVSVKLGERQFRLFLNMPLSSCKFKYNKRNSSCLVLVSLCLYLNHKELNKKVIHDLVQVRAERVKRDLVQMRTTYDSIYLFQVW